MESLLVFYILLDLFEEEILQMVEIEQVEKSVSEEEEELEDLEEEIKED